MDDKKQHPRYPYTYCTDFIRSLAGYNNDGTKLSRSDASHIRQTFTKILGLDDKETAKKLADYYLEHEDEISQKSADEFLRIFRKSRLK